VETSRGPQAQRSPEARCRRRRGRQGEAGGTPPRSRAPAIPKPVHRPGGSPTPARAPHLRRRPPFPEAAPAPAGPGDAWRPRWGRGAARR